MIGVDLLVIEQLLVAARSGYGFTDDLACQLVPASYRSQAAAHSTPGNESRCRAAPIPPYRRRQFRSGPGRWAHAFAPQPTAVAIPATWRRRSSRRLPPSSFAEIAFGRHESFLFIGKFPVPGSPNGEAGKYYKPGRRREINFAPQSDETAPEYPSRDPLPTGPREKPCWHTLGAASVSGKTMSRRYKDGIGASGPTRSGPARPPVWLEPTLNKGIRGGALPTTASVGACRRDGIRILPRLPALLCLCAPVLSFTGTELHTRFHG